ncbi:hypothetical protein [Rhodococcus sp. USK13]|uniref:hypothetical protein n=1 Tax=Rhodococcus sp. USK13 TaxID=2806442 RepID=UPI001BCB8EBE|nr:hypothetical protein [Rhodococcus sp. USK13]
MLSSSGALEAKTTPGPRSRRVERGSTRNPFIYAAIVVFGLALFWLSEPSRAGGQILEQYGGWQVIAYMLLYTLPTIVAVTAACWRSNRSMGRHRRRPCRYHRAR